MAYEVKSAGCAQPLKGDSRLSASPTVWMAVLLLMVYASLSLIGGSIFALNLRVAHPLVQDNSSVWRGAVWKLFTAMFLHADLLHLGGNLFFLLLFGTALEERVSKGLWLATYLVSGMVGNVTFLFLGGDAIGVGASGAIWGLLAAAGGFRGLAGMVFYGGLNIFAGGGFLAHAGGLLAGLAMRYSMFRIPHRPE